jgi:hypothetical protein
MAPSTDGSTGPGSKYRKTNAGLEKLRVFAGRIGLTGVTKKGQIKSRNRVGRFHPVHERTTLSYFEH